MSVTMTAPAKINLYLDVGPARADGYHTLTTVFLALDFGDEVTVAPSDRLSLACVPDVGVAPEENLAWRAAVAMGETFGRAPRFDIRIEKRIPAGGGLGGGSSDAAAVIAAIAASWDVPRDDVHLEIVAASLGADVPFLLRGGCAVYAGRGDVFRRALKTPPAHVAIAAPGTPVSTAEAYAAFDRVERPASRGVRYITDPLSFGDLDGICAGLYNNMTGPAIGLVPAIGDVLSYMQAAQGCCGSAMCGSGSAVFGLFARPELAEAAAAAAREHGWWAVATAPRPGGTLDGAMGVPDATYEGRRRHSRRR